MAGASVQMMVRVAFAAAVLSLSACGGGNNVETGRPVTYDWQGDQPVVLATNRTKIFNAVDAAAVAHPRFGSVTQSSNRGGDGLTTDRARIAFDGQRPTLTVTRADGRRVTLSAVEHSSSVAESRPSRLHDYTSGGWASLRVTEDSISVSRFVVSWNSYDPTDYLAGAYWLHFSDLRDPAGFQFDHVEMGAVVDGPGLTTEPVLPATGGASYSGPVHGYFVVEDGATAGDDPLSAQGSLELGSFTSTIDLYASFRGQDPVTQDYQAPFIHGYIGYAAPMQFHSLEVDEDSGPVSPLADSHRNYAVELDLTSVAPDGTFHGSGVSVSVSGVPAIESAGYWGGTLSSVQDRSGFPRSAAGTFGATFTTDDQSRGAFTGMFVGWEPSRLVVE